MLLAIDTSTAVASVALFGRLAPGRDELGILVEYTWRAGQRHTTQLLPRIERILCDVGAKPPDLSCIAVALGPGSFNGIRVGISTAKLLATSLDLPLVGVSTLEATAYAYRDAAALATLAAGRSARIRPLDDAGRGQIATALYRCPLPGEATSGDLVGESSLGLADLVELEAPRIADLADLLHTPEPGEGPTLICGEVRAEWAAELRRLAAGWIVVASESGSLRRAGPLAELAWLRLTAGLTDDPATLQAIYLRRPPVLDRESLPELG